MKVRFLLLLMLVMGICTFSCKKVEEPEIITKTKLDTVCVPDTVVVASGDGEFIVGPKPGTWDYYVSMCYSGEQNYANGMHHYYFLLTDNDSVDGVKELMVKVQGQTVNLKHEIYSGKSFFVGYFDERFDSVYHFELTINGETTTMDFVMNTDITSNMPNYLTQGEGVELEWETNLDPKQIYLEAFQHGEGEVLKKKCVAFPDPSSRSYSIPAEWLWSEDEVVSRSIQLGTMNYKIKNRLCITMGDNEFKKYQNN